jgi:hypothetical protein
MNLYELMGEYARLQTACYGEGEDQPDVAEIERILAELDETRGELRDKVDNICAVLRNLSGHADAIEAEQERLRRRRTALENAEVKLREWVRTSMDVMGVDKIKTVRNTVYLSAGAPSVIVVSEDQIPADYVTTKTVVTVDKRAILANFKQNGEVLPGVDIVPGQRKLTIR